MSRLYIYPRDTHQEFDEVVEMVFRSILKTRLPITSWICEFVLPRWAWKMIGVRVRAVGIPPAFEVWGLGIKIATFNIEPKHET